MIGPTLRRRYSSHLHYVLPAYLSRSTLQLRAVVRTVGNAGHWLISLLIIATQLLQIHCLPSHVSFECSSRKRLTMYYVARETSFVNRGASELMWTCCVTYEIFLRENKSSYAVRFWSVIPLSVTCSISWPLLLWFYILALTTAQQVSSKGVSVASVASGTVTIVMIPVSGCKGLGQGLVYLIYLPPRPRSLLTSHIIPSSLVRLCRYPQAPA